MPGVFNGIAATKGASKSDARNAIRDKFNCRTVLWLKSTMAKLPETFENGLAKRISWKPKNLSISNRTWAPTAAGQCLRSERSSKNEHCPARSSIEPFRKVMFRKPLGNIAEVNSPA
jgi:hypothetical protein